MGGDIGQLVSDFLCGFRRSRRCREEYGVVVVSEREQKPER